MFSTLRTHILQHRTGRGILILWALCSLILVAASIQPVSADTQPTLQFSTYLGGNGNEHGENIALDSDGNIYVTGDTASADFPATNPLGATAPGIYLTKFDPTATTQLYSIFLGQGSAYGIVVDADGYAYVVGLGRDIPTVSAIQPTLRGFEDAFIAKINPSGTGLVYSTYLGGDSEDFALSVGLDANRNAYVVGVTMSTNFPTQNPYQATYGGGQWDVFIARLNAEGSALVYSTYYGGSDWDISTDIAVDSAGNAYITGDTASTNFPVVNPYQATLKTPCVYPPSSPCRDATVVKFNPAGTPVYSTYFGGTGNNDRGNGIAVDSLGSIYITGETTSSNLPTTVNAFQTTSGTSNPSFVTKFSPDGSTLVYSTYLTGTISGSGAESIAVTGNGQALITGITAANDFPTVNPIQATRNGPSDVFISQLSADGSSLLFSTYFGGSGDEGVEFSPRLALDLAGSVYITSTTLSDDFPVLNAFQSDPAGPFSPTGPFGIVGPPNFDAFVTKIGFQFVPHAEPAQAAARNYYTTPTPTLTWTPITWAMGYRVQVSKDKLFTGTPDFEGETAANVLSIPTDALDNGLYYWRVQAQKANDDWGGWSPVESFIIYAS